MERIIRITILSLWMYGAKPDEQIMKKVQTLQNSMDQLHQDFSKMDFVGRLLYPSMIQEMDSQKYDLLNQLSNEAKQKIADEFMAAFTAKLRDKDAYQIVSLFFVENAPYINDLPNFIRFDRQSSVELTEIQSSALFITTFDALTTSELVHSKHRSSIECLISFMKTGRINVINPPQKR